MTTIPPLRSSHVDELLRSPGHYLTMLTSPQRDSEALKFGRLFHYLLLECDNPTKELARYWFKPPEVDGRTKTGKEWIAQHDPSLRLDSEDDILNLRGMLKAVDSDGFLRELLSSPYTQTELPLAWQNEEYEIPCTGKADLVYYPPLEDNLDGDCLIIDFKTTDDARKHSISFSVKRYLYHCQAAMYCHGVTQKYRLDKEPRYMIVAIEKEPPYGLQKYELSFSTLEKGREIYRRVAGIYAACLRNNNWPVYEDKTEVLDI